MHASVGSTPVRWFSWRAAAALVVLALVALSVPLLGGSARAATGPRIDLRVLVVSNGDPSAEAIATQLDREGVPYTKVSANPAGRPAIDAAFLSDAATQRARYQAVVLPNQAGGGLPAAEVAALTAYERLYGIRQVNAYDYPGASMGFAAPTYAGSLDGGTVTVSSAGTSGPFGYLRGSLTVDDFASGLEVYGYLAQPLATQAAGATFTPMLNASAGGSTGVLAGVYAKDGREELTLSAAYNPGMQWFNQVAQGVVTWMTRGVHLGHQRNYFAVHVDDVFLPDSRWSSTGDCTPGDNCASPGVTTPDIRMTAADVTRLMQWQNTNQFKLDMVYNGGGSALWLADQAEQPGGATSDALLAAFLANEGQFPWINHTFTHPFLGCIQLAPTVVGQQWTCADDATQGPRQDEEIPSAPGPSADGTAPASLWASQAFLTAQIADNIAFAREHGLTDFDPAELVTGEHSGLATLPQQQVDNPFLAAALTANQVRYTASDNSREAEPRSVGSAVTVPRFPMNIFYNAGTYQDEVDEYNWIYTSVADGGSGICTANPQTSTCIAPLPADTAAQATASFTSYILPIEVRNALSKITTNNPRPFYAHQSNLAEDGILYPVVTAILDGYESVYAANAPVVRTDMTTQSAVLARQAAWKAASAGTTAWIDSDGVHVPDVAASVPLTVPTGTSVSGVTMESYGGELSAWAGGTVTAVPTTPMGGYVGTPAAVVPGAPTIGTATPGNASATVTWTAPASNGGSAITGYRVDAFAGDATTATGGADGAAGATSVVVPGLVNGTPYTFTVKALNAVGTGPASTRTASVTPLAGTPSAPQAVTATAGNASATVAWQFPATDGGANISAFVVTAYEGTSTTPLPTTVEVPGGTLSTPFTGLTNGTAYTFTVAAKNSSGVGAASARTAAVTPVTVPDAPTIGPVTGGNAQATVTWTAPASNGGSAVTGYTVTAYAGSATTPATSVPATATATSVVVPGLTNGTSYTFTVTAANAVGAGTASGRSQAVVPAAPVTVPGAPTIGTVTGGNAQATVTWTAPASTGGAPVTGYRIDVYAGSGTTPATSVSAAATATSAVVPGLTNGTSYTFTVTATNAAGNSPTSARSTAVVPAAPVTVPGAPTIGTPTAGNASATVTWTAPASTGGAALTGYTVSAYVGSATTPATSVNAAATATSVVVPGLSNGTAYTFTVTALNSAGAGTVSARSTAVTPVAAATVPGAPVFTSVAGTNAAVALAWSIPANGGSPITGYTVTAYLGTGTTVVKTMDVTATSADVTGLANGTSYSFTVTAKNAQGSGPASQRSATVTPTTAPDAPAIGQVTAGNASVTVQWTAPVNTGGSPISGYTVRAYPGSATTAAVTVQAGASATSTVVPGLTNGTAYTFTVAAVTTAGTSPESARSAGATPTAPIALPGAPTIGTAIGGDRRATAVWTAPAQTGTSAITRYSVAVYSGTGTTPVRTVTAGATATSLVVTGLTNGTAYTFTVAAVNGSGTGTASARSNAVTPAALPGAPRTVRATVGNGSVDLTWRAPTQNGGSAITGYVVVVRSGGQTVRTVPVPGTATSTTVSGLTNGTAYTFTVAATTAAGTGPASAGSDRVTPGAVPGAPTLGTVTPGNRSLTVTWSAPTDAGGAAVTGYVVSVYSGTGTQPVRTTRPGRTATSTSVTGLTNGTAYTVTVAAVNRLGTGPATARSVPTTPAVPVVAPSAPTLRNATAGVRSATVIWRAPGRDGGSPITGYVVHVYQGTSNTVLRTLPASATATSLTVTGLTSGTTYRFRVAAENAVGTGALSGRSPAVRPRA
jgi:hypothetical protein